MIGFFLVLFSFTANLVNLFKFAKKMIFSRNQAFQLHILPVLFGKMKF